MNNADSYNNIAYQWKKYRDQSEINQCIVDFETLLPRHSRILDIGCGTGFPIASYFVSKGHQVIGIDFSKQMINFAKQLNLRQALFEVCDFLNYPASEPFDALIGFDSLFHYGKKQQYEIYPKASSLLKPNGYFLFTAGKNAGEASGKMYDYQFTYGSLDQNELCSILASNHFDIISFQIDYKEKTTGTRDLLVVVQKQNL